MYGLESGKLLIILTLMQWRKVSIYRGVLLQDNGICINSENMEIVNSVDYCEYGMRLYWI